MAGSQRRRGLHARLLAGFGALYALSLLAYYLCFRRLARSRVSSPQPRPRPPGYVALRGTRAVRAAQRFLCAHRKEAARTILAHVHIQKSGGTAFALALKSECICNDASSFRPQKGYCRQCPHVLEDETMPPTVLRQNLWTVKNESFEPHYARNCPRYQASARWSGFQKRNRTQTFYSLNRLTTGWPCGVHVGYARMRMCTNRLQLRGVRHVMVTLFREPMSRYMSEFYQTTFHRIAIDSWDWCMMPEKPILFDNYLKMPVDFPFQSRVTKMLSGSPVQTGAAGEDWNIRGVREKALERALGVVRSTEDFMFGLAERLDETLELFGFVFKRSFYAPSPCHAHANSTGTKCSKVEIGLHDRNGKSFAFTAQQMRDFRDKNLEDVVIYEEAKRIFEIRMEALRELQRLGSDLAIDDKCRELLSEPVETAA